MADEITFGFATGKTLKYGVYTAAGGVRTAAGTTFDEEGATGYYHADNGDIIASDIVIVTEGALVVGWGEYLPEVVSAALSEELDDIVDEIDDNEGKIDQVIEDLAISKGEWDERPKDKRADVIIG